MLRRNICGIEFENPFLLASAPPTANIDSIRKAFALGWGGAVLKTISSESLEIRDASPRFGVLKDGRRTVGFQNIELLSRHPLSYWQDGIAALKRDFPSKVIIASIMAPVVKEEWQHLVTLLQKLPVDAFELNFSCPHGMPEQGLGMAIGTNASLSAEITGWVKEAAKIPVFVKLTPNVTAITEIARAVAEAGADGITAINTVGCIIGVHLDTLEPLPNVGGLSAFGGYSGKAVKPIGLKAVASIAQQERLPILGVGGISSWQDAVEYMALGAHAVQVCTEVMLNGYGVIKGMLNGLEEYMESRNLTDLTAIVCKALPKIVAHEALDKSLLRKAQIQGDLCNACRKCETICEESGSQAIQYQDGHMKVMEDRCDGCGLCALICPTQAIIHM